MDIKGKNALVLGGFGLVGQAVCRNLLAYQPARLVIGSLRKSESEQAVTELQKEYPDIATKFIPIGGDIFLRGEWQTEGTHPRPLVLADPKKRRRLVKDILGALDDEILESSFLYQMIMGKAPGMDGAPADIVIDCINTSTAVAYQNVYKTANHMSALIDENSAETDWANEVEMLLSSLYIPQLVRHIQIFHESMQRAKTTAYIKVGTAGTGGMGLNIPYTHGEEKPSRVLMSKAALGGAQTLLTFLMARTPGGL
ncbi:MAG: short-chain dehydrogenase, partial [Chloroflexota bacterium]